MLARMTKKQATLSAVALVLLVLIAFWWYHDQRSATAVNQPLVTYAELTGTVFTGGEGDPWVAPRVRELVLPETPDATAIWGATGRDFGGHIYVGVSATRDGMSAHLLEYDPDRDAWRDRGSVVEALKRAGLYHEGEGQIKIHSKIVPGADGRLYFASSDEQGESEGGTPPRWGGHLWRLDPKRDAWEHLLATPEGLVAVSGVGRYMYALGYWNHVLYQFDTQTGNHKRIVVGSVGGHVSRNFLADIRGHAYVPRARMNGSTPVAELVEYYSDLREIAATPLEAYFDSGPPAENHGITAIAYLKDGRLRFVTHRGYLYGIGQRSEGPARIDPIGWLHPDGAAYAASLFAWAPGWLAGITLRGGRYEWVAHDTGLGTSQVSTFDVGRLNKLLLYGSVTRDDHGRGYVGGWAAKDARTGDMRPVMLQIEAAR